MFATVTGALPRTTAAGVDLDEVERRVEEGHVDPGELPAASDELVRELLAEQEAAGLEPLTDGQAWTRDLHGHLADALVSSGSPAWAGPILVDAWRRAASATELAVKQALPGPYTLGRRLAGGRDAEDLTLAVADALAREVAALAVAGCPLIEVEEPAATGIGEDGASRELFVEAQRRLLRHAQGTHVSLAVTGGDAATAGDATFFETPYDSFLFDLIAGPDHWRLVANAPSELGIVCGALDVRAEVADEPAILVWAAHYAASTGGRGLARVGLSSASSLRHLTRERAARKLRALGAAARIATGSDEEITAALDPRAIRRRRHVRLG